MPLPERVKTQMKKEGLSGVNKPKKTPSHPTKSHVVMASENEKYKLIRFGQQGVSGSPAKEGESKAKATGDKAGKQMVKQPKKVVDKTAAYRK